MELLYPLVQLQLLKSLLNWSSFQMLHFRKTARGIVQTTTNTLSILFGFVFSIYYFFFFGKFSLLFHLSNLAHLSSYLTLYSNPTFKNGELFKKSNRVKMQPFLKIWFIPFEVQEFSFVRRLRCLGFYYLSFSFHPLQTRYGLWKLRFYLQTQIKWINK